MSYRDLEEWLLASDRVCHALGLRRDARRYGRYQGRERAWMMVADGGFDGRGWRKGI